VCVWSSVCVCVFVLCVCGWAVVFAVAFVSVGVYGVCVVCVMCVCLCVLITLLRLVNY